MHVAWVGFEVALSERMHVERVQLDFMGLESQRDPFERDGKGMLIQTHLEPEITAWLGSAFQSRTCGKRQAVVGSSGQALLSLPPEAACSTHARELGGLSWRSHCLFFQDGQAHSEGFFSP